jgi:hypothetical protein
MVTPAIAPSNNGNMGKAILLGGLAVGVGDFFDANFFFGLIRHVPYGRIWHSVASGLLGRDAFSGGAKTIALGIFLHFCIATIVAAVYMIASRKLRFLVGERWATWGLAYGLAVNVVMQYVVIPLSNVPKPASPPPFVLAVFLNGYIGHALLVGLPAALVARKYLR